MNRTKPKQKKYFTHSYSVLKLPLEFILGKNLTRPANCSNDEEDMNQKGRSKSVESTFFYIQNDCPDKFLDFKLPLDYCFKVFVNILPKRGALDECQKIGASLLVISSEEEYESIRRVLRIDSLEMSWIGLSLNGKFSL